MKVSSYSCRRRPEIVDVEQLVVTNDTDEAVALATYGGTPFLLTSQYWNVDATGPIEHGCQVVRPTGEAGLFAKYNHIEVPAHGEFRTGLAIDGLGAPGHYTARVTYDGRGAPQDGPKPLFEGRIVSSEASFDIKQPTGVDAEIVKAWREIAPDAPWCDFPVALMNALYIEQGIDWDHFLLREYPTSTYAAYLLTGGGRDRISEELPADYLGCVSAGDCPRGTQVQDLSVLSFKWKSVDGPGMVRWRKKWYSLVLKHHPDIWFADELRLRLALDQLAIKMTEQANLQLQALATGARARVRQRAKEYLSLMLADGMIKRSALPAELRAKLPKVEPPAKKPVAKDKLSASHRLLGDTNCTGPPGIEKRDTTLRRRSDPE